MTTGEIIKKYLTENGYEGLCCDGCGCDIDDLFCCGDVISDCKPAYRHPIDCVNCDMAEECSSAHDAGSMNGRDFCYGTEKPEAKK